MELEHLRVLVAVADAGGFAAAARQLAMSPPAVTRAVAALEQHLGARLLHRTTRALRPTEIGERFLGDARRILAAAAEAEASARGAHAEPQGELAITAPVMFGRLHIAPLVLDFVAAHPKLQARMLFVDRVVHLMDEGFDVAVRLAPLPDSSLTALTVGAVRRLVVASPDYLARHGTPDHPDALAAHLGIAINGGASVSPRWRFVMAPGEAPRETAQPVMRVASSAIDVAIEAALAGHGLVRVLSYQVREHLAAGRLQRVLQAFEPAPVPVHLVYPEGRQAAAKVRAFVAYAAARLRAAPALAEA